MDAQLLGVRASSCVRSAIAFVPDLELLRS